MDEALGFVAVDLSGRPYAVIDVAWHTPMLGAMDADLVRHFLETVAIHGQLNLHAACSTAATTITRPRRCSRRWAAR